MRRLRASGGASADELSILRVHRQARRSSVAAPSTAPRRTGARCPASSLMRNSMSASQEPGVGQERSTGGAVRVERPVPSQFTAWIAEDRSAVVVDIQRCWDAWWECFVVIFVKLAAVGVRATHTLMPIAVQPDPSARAVPGLFLFTVAAIGAGAVAPEIGGHVN